MTQLMDKLTGKGNETRKRTSRSVFPFLKMPFQILLFPHELINMSINNLFNAVLCKFILKSKIFIELFSSFYNSPLIKKKLYSFPSDNLGPLYTSTVFVYSSARFMQKSTDRGGGMQLRVKNPLKRG